MRSRSGLSAIYIIVGLSALLVSTSRAIPGPLEREASIRLGSTFEPKYKTYFSDNQVYNSGNSMD